MYRLLKMLVVLTLPMVLTACAKPQAAPNEHLVAAVKLANRELELAFREGDYEGVAQMYADDAIILSASGDRVEGREEIDRSWIRDWQDANWRLDVIEVYGTEEMPIQIGRSQLTFRREDTGERTTSDTRFAAIWRRHGDGTYRILIDTYWRE